jgi:alanine dehydrogenase
LLLLSKDDIVEIVKMHDLIGIMEGAFREYANGSVEMPLRPMLRSDEPAGTAHIMPAIMHSSRAMGLKFVAHYPANPEKHGVPVINATILYNDFETGRVEAIMSGTLLTAMRTAAVSGVATRYLARNDSETVGILGSGMQAQYHLEAMAEVRRIKSAKVYSPTRSHRSSFAERMSKKLGIDVSEAETGKLAIDGADIIVTATPAKSPIVMGSWLVEGMHVNAVGSGTPNLRELDEEVLSKSKIVADDVAAATAETGDFLIPMREGKFDVRSVYCGLGDLVTGRKIGRASDEEITLFKSVGLAIEDVAAAKFIYDEAARRGLGNEVVLE